MDSKGIARALREQLGTAGIDISMAQALEVVAKTGGYRNWNTLVHSSSKKPESADLGPGIHYCPQCGKTETLKVKASAFVEQGEYVGSSYEFEGQADHYACKHCGYQFLDWSSDAVSGQDEEGNERTTVPADYAPTMDSILAEHGITLGLCGDSLNAGDFEWYEKETRVYSGGFSTRAEAYRGARAHLLAEWGILIPSLDNDDNLVFTSNKTLKEALGIAVKD